MTESPKTANDLMNRGPVIPVVVIDRAGDAVPLARALLAGGVDTMEITLRTAYALDAIRSVAEQVPDMAVGAGTIVRPEQAREAVGAGAAFLVSPGSTPRLLEALLDEAVPILPGAATAGDRLDGARRHRAEVLSRRGRWRSQSGWRAGRSTARYHFLPHRRDRSGDQRGLPGAAERGLRRRVLADTKRSRRRTEVGCHHGDCGRDQWGHALMARCADFASRDH